MKTKTKIEKQLHRKINKDLVNTIIAAKKHKNWNEIAHLLSSPRRKKIYVNLQKINEEGKEGEKIMVPGKVLSLGEIEKKIKISAVSFSERAKEKLLKYKCEVSTILEEIKKNPEAKGVKILK